MNKKFLAALLIAAAATTTAIGFAGCSLFNSDSSDGSDTNQNQTDDGNKSDNGKTDNTDEKQETPTHTHIYDQKFTTYAKYLASSATCTAKATYYYSCTCGEKGTETFEYGDLTAHNYENDVCTMCGKTEPTPSEGLAYTLSDDGTYYTVTGIGTCTDTELVIPATHENLPVTAIGDMAFAQNTSLTNVTIPNSVTSIGEVAFAYCSSLTSITIPDSVTSIGDHAFAYCSSLTSITIPDSVTSIGYDAFRYCSSLTSVTIGNSVTSIEDNAFYWCSKLTSITIPDSVTKIGSSAFSGCSNLIQTENGVRYVDKWVIGYDTSITSVTLRSDTKGIADEAFRYYSKLTGVYYKGTEEKWSSVSIGGYNSYLTSATIYYYTETEPALNSDGNYWHYDTDGKTPVIWKKES